MRQVFPGPDGSPARSAGRETPGRARRGLAGAAVALAVAVTIPLAGQGPPPDTKLPPLPPPHLPLVTSQDLLDGLKNPSRWLIFSGNYTGQRHSPLKQITPENVRRMTAQWTF